MTTPADGHQPPARFIESGVEYRTMAQPPDGAALPTPDPRPATATVTLPAPPVPAPPAPAPPAAVAGEDDDLFDRAWDRPRRTNRLTAVLVVGLVAVAGFAVGVTVQKQHDQSLTASPTAGLAGAGAGAGRQGAGGYTGFGAPGGGAQAGTGPGAAPSGAAPSGAAPSGAAASGVPVVVGTVKSISGTTLVVTNFAGTAVTVKVPASATVTTSGLGGLTAGATVSVEGSTAADGTVTATAIVSHQG